MICFINRIYDSTSINEYTHAILIIFSETDVNV